MSPRVPLAAIASLTLPDLYFNPHYCELRQQYDSLSKALLSYAEQVLSLRRATENTHVTSVYQAIASQPSRLTVAIDVLLEMLEPLTRRPAFLPKSVLWDYEDCYDQMENVIVTEFNTRRIEMGLAIRRGDGTKISSQEFIRIRRAADIISLRLVNLIHSDPRYVMLVANLWTKSNIKKVFHAEYRKAILDLEAEHNILRLCSAHWKADTMIDQAILWESDTETKPLTDDTCDMEDPPQPSKPQVSDVVPMKSAKRVFELCPGPKSPSVSRAQKRSKGNAVGGTSSRVPVVPITRPSCRDVAMSSVPPLAPRRMLTFKRSTPITDNLAVTQTLETAPTRSDATTHQQGAAGTELTQKPSARSKDVRADALWLRLLHVSELRALFRDIKLSMPKSRRKGDLIANIVSCPQFAHISRSTIQGIVEKRYVKKRLLKQQGPLQ